MAILYGCVLLIAEQHPLVQMDLQKICEDAGAKVLVARSQAEALAVAEKAVLTAAVIDYSLAEMADGEFSSENSETSLSERLRELDIPFVFCSARNHGVASHQRDIPFVEKPFQKAEIVDALASVIIRKGTQASQGGV